MQPCIDESCPRKPFPNEVNRASSLACTEARHKAEALGTRGHLPKPFVRVLRAFRVLVPSPQGRGLSQGLALWKETPKDGRHMDWKDFPETLVNTPGTPRKLHGHATTDTVSSSPLPLGAMQHEGCRGFGTQPLRSFLWCQSIADAVAPKLHDSMNFEVAVFEITRAAGGCGCSALGQ